MGTNYAITPKNSASYAIDLTSVDVNPGAAPTSTPRQGGFTLRNRINFSHVDIGNKKLADVTLGTAATAGYTLRVLEVPERVLVRDVQIYAVKSETVPGVSAYTTASGTTAGFHADGLQSGHLAALQINIGAEQRSKPLSSSSYAAASHLDIYTGSGIGQAAGNVFGFIPTALTSSSSDLSTIAFSSSMVEAVDSSMTAPELAMVNTNPVVASIWAGSLDASRNIRPQYFALGGYVTLAAGPHAGALGSATDGSTGGTDSIRLTGTWEIQANCNYVPE